MKNIKTNPLFKKKSAQIKFGESIGVIFIVFIVIFAGSVWYNKINTNSILEISQNDEKDKAFEKYNFLNQLDLIHKSTNGVISPNYDLNSLIVFSEFAKTNEGKKLLTSQLGFGKITLNIFDDNGFLINSPNLNLTIYNNTGNFKIKNEIRFQTYIPVENNGQTSIGFLNFNIYSKS